MADRNGFLGTGSARLGRELLTAQVFEMQASREVAVATAGAEAPPWVFALLGATADAMDADWNLRTDGTALRRIESAGHTLWSLRVPDALNRDAESFEQACAEAYRTLGRQVEASGHPYAVRWWNFIPGILEPLGALEHRYMVFNAGRFQALADAGVSADWGRLATASGVGHAGAAFVLHCLSAAAPGRQIENPRQIPAWRYSLRYGPKPPCFARATRVERSERGQHGAGAWLLVGGTASVRGEDSFHRDDLQGQLDETLRNLAALVGAAEGRELREADEAALLTRYRELRVYHPRRADGRRLEKELRRRLGPGPRLEMVHADLCRAELLVEIEGLAELQG